MFLQDYFTFATSKWTGGIAASLSLSIFTGTVTGFLVLPLLEMFCNATGITDDDTMIHSKTSTATTASVAAILIRESLLLLIRSKIFSDDKIAEKIMENDQTTNLLTAAVIKKILKEGTIEQDQEINNRVQGCLRALRNKDEQPLLKEDFVDQLAEKKGLHLVDPVRAIFTAGCAAGILWLAFDLLKQHSDVLDDFSDDMLNLVSIISGDIGNLLWRTYIPNARVHFFSNCECKDAINSSGTQPLLDG